MVNVGCKQRTTATQNSGLGNPNGQSCSIFPPTFIYHCLTCPLPLFALTLPLSLSLFFLSPSLSLSFSPLSPLSTLSHSPPVRQAFTAAGISTLSEFIREQLARGICVGKLRFMESSCSSGSLDSVASAVCGAMQLLHPPRGPPVAVCRGLSCYSMV